MISKQNRCALQLDLNKLFGADSRAEMAGVDIRLRQRGFTLASLLPAEAIPAEKACQHEHHDHGHHHHGHNHDHHAHGHAKSGHTHSDSECGACVVEAVRDRTVTTATQRCESVTASVLSFSEVNTMF